jgi:hypothetical protein
MLGSDGISRRARCCGGVVPIGANRVAEVIRFQVRLVLERIVSRPAYQCLGLRARRPGQ